MESVPTDSAHTERAEDGRTCTTVITRNKRFWIENPCVIDGGATDTALVPVIIGTSTLATATDVVAFLTQPDLDDRVRLGKQITVANLNVKAFAIESVTGIGPVGGSTTSVSALLALANELYDHGNDESRARMVRILETINTAGLDEDLWFDPSCEAEPEYCDGLDNDEDGTIDEACACMIELCDGTDNDGDGTVDEGYDGDSDGTADCYDIETCDGVDNNGDGAVDENFDADKDGVADCFGVEICDGMDNNGDGVEDEGFDGDDDGTPDCEDIEVCDGLDNDGDGAVDDSFDSDSDGVADCFSGEVCDGLDNNGDGRTDEGFDADDDGTADCFDVEVCDGLDNNGDGRWDELFDADNDTVPDCFEVEVCDGLDNDGDGNADEGLDLDDDGTADCFDVETCDGLDNDGDEQVDEDFDADADTLADCFDTEESDGLDNDGNGLVDEGFDLDLDGIADFFDEEECDGLDNDANGYTDEGFDSDADALADCFDTEVCDGLDNDGDGLADEGMDSDFDSTPNCFDAEESDGLDNDGNGLVDEGFDVDADGVADFFDTETCDGVDNNGDGLADEGLDSDLDGIADCFDTPPNILLIIADDMGVDKVSSYYDDYPGYAAAATQEPQTPTIDDLAAAGLRFTQAWANPVCSPTRATVYTGRHGFRTGVTDAVPNAGSLLTTETTIAEALAGTHVSGLFGKWHLGSTSDPGNVGWDTLARNKSRSNPGTVAARPNPMLHGWKDFYGFLSGSISNFSSWTTIYSTNYGYDPSMRQYSQAWTETVYATDAIVDETLDWITTQTDPWMATVAFNAPHTSGAMTTAHNSLPCAGTTQTGSSTRQSYQAMVHCLDAGIEDLLAGIEDETLANTLIVFMGDNGTSAILAEGDFASSDRGKGTSYQTGVQVPFIITDGAAWIEYRDTGVANDHRVRSPNREVDAPVHVMDVYATVTEMLGASASTATDSVSLIPYLEEEDADWQREQVYTETYMRSGGLYSGSAAVRDEQYKLVVKMATNGGTNCRRLELYDLEADPFERTNLATSSAYASTLSSMTSLLNTVNDGSVPTWLSVGACP